MSEFVSTSPEVQAERTSEYAPIDSDTAQILAECVDEIIALQEHGRSASCTSTAFSEWFETSALLADATLDYAYLWPPTEQRLMLRRIRETGDQALGETYQMVIEWSVKRNDVIEPGYTRSYALMIPCDASEDPKLLMCQQQSSFIGLANGLELTVGTNDSGYHEVDVLLDQSFYARMTIATQYDAERLFDELSLFGDMLARSGD